MKEKTKTVITLEAWQRTTIRRRQQTAVLWCKQCAAEVEMIMPEEAARQRGTSPRAIYRHIEKGELHFIETDAGVLLICDHSLKNKNYKTKGA